MIGVFAARSPRTAGALSVVLGTGSLGYDARDFYNAKTSREQIKYGTASVADAEILTGGALILARKMPKAGPALLLTGIAARFLIDFLPNEVNR